MNSNALVLTHIIVVNIFLLIYLIKTILIFTNQNALLKFSKAVKVPEMIISVLFLVTGVWLFAILGAIKLLQIIKLALILIAIPVAIVGYKKMNKVMALLSFPYDCWRLWLGRNGKRQAVYAENCDCAGRCFA